MRSTRLFRRLSCLGLTLGLMVVGTTLMGCEPNPLLRRQATDALALNQIDRAENRLEKALKQDPTDGKSHYYMGLVRLRQDKPLAAQLHLEKALTLQHERELVPDIIDALAESLFQQKEYATLTAMLKKAGSDYGTARDFLREAKYLIRMNDLDGAKLAFRKATRLSNLDNEKPYMEMADLFDSVGDSESAVLALRYAYTIKPNSPVIHAKLRQHGMIPGPSVALQPDRTDTPENPYRDPGDPRNRP